jgi:hypothetical protein
MLKHYDPFISEETLRKIFGDIQYSPPTGRTLTMHTLIRENSIDPVPGQAEYDMILRDKIFIYCNGFSTRWQWSVNLYKNRKGRAIYKRRNNIQNNTKSH